MTISGEQQSYIWEKQALLASLKKIEGHIQGIRRMIENDRYYDDIVQQLTALRGTADGVSLTIIHHHIAMCVADAIGEQHRNEHIKALTETICKMIRRQHTS